MPISWYICPYDVSKQGPRVVRVPAISRYLPTVPHVSGGVWDEAEILGNHLIVKVNAPAAIHTQIQGDPDFRVIPTGQVAVPVAAQALLSTKLQALGYTKIEITGTNWNVGALLTLLTTARTMFQMNATKDGIDLLPGRKPPSKTVAHINARLPG